MPFANINFSRLIKVAVSFSVSLSLSLSLVIIIIVISLSLAARRRIACIQFYFTSYSIHVGRHVVGVLRGPESEIGVLVVTVALVVFGRHRHED
jgi:hypothetical protein